MVLNGFEWIQITDTHANTNTKNIPIIYGLDWALAPALAQRRALALARILGAGPGPGQGPIQSIYYWYILGIGMGICYLNPFKSI